MKKVTEEQIRQVVYDLAKESDTYIISVEPVEVEFIRITDDETLFQVTMMYSSPIEFSEKAIAAFVDLFDTNNIDFYDEISQSGCETCDYYSKYGWAIRAWK